MIRRREPALAAAILTLNAQATILLSKAAHAQCCGIVLHGAAATTMLRQGHAIAAAQLIQSAPAIVLSNEAVLAHWTGHALLGAAALTEPRQGLVAVYAALDAMGTTA